VSELWNSSEIISGIVKSKVLSFKASDVQTLDGSARDIVAC